MKWTTFTIETTPEACDAVSGILLNYGIENIEVQDSLPVYDEKQGGVFEELQPDMAVDADVCRILFYVDEDFDAGEMIEKISQDIEAAREFVDIGDGKILVDKTDEADWRNNWKEYFHAFSIGGLQFVPTWEEASVDAGNIIRIDPGIAFGTGKHESTQLCITALQRYVKGGEAVLDLGFGSGILSIVALKLGAGSVAGTDIDEDCLISAVENFKNNGQKFPKDAFHIGNLATDATLKSAIGEECYDIVVANILADIIIEMLPQIPRRMKPGGIFISSGIIDFKADEVRAAIESAGLIIREENHQGEWVSFVAVKPE